MRLRGGDPALDFVNTVGGRTASGGRAMVTADKLGGYGDLVGFVRRIGLLDDAVARGLVRRSHAQAAAARRVLARAVRLREALHRTLDRSLAGLPSPPSDLAILNREVEASRRQEALATEGHQIRWQWRDARALEAPLWPLVRAAAVLLTSAELRRLRRCGGDGCGWLFLDRSRSGRRRWCSMEDCGNRAKVRRFRRRQVRRR
jgi:predicted RNA-binding Zn ribbon-like protein